MKFEDWITEDIKCVLLVEPNFPIPNKSRNHSNFLPIGLLKLASYLRSKSIEVKLIRYEDKKNIDSSQANFDHLDEPKNLFKPDLICVTSIFTYWSKYVIDAVQHYKNKYPKTPIIVGGVYASLMPEHCKKHTKCDDVITGTVSDAEKLTPAYDLVDVDYQILHTTRGCIRKCGFCGTYIIEPKFLSKKTIKDEIIKKKLVFYDNNLLANPYIKNILEELIELKKEHKISYVESQSGFDGRILRKHPELCKMLKDAGFKNLRIAWDNKYEEAPLIKQQIQILLDAGFTHKDISVFMVYNYELPYTELEKKRVKCAEWGVQIMDCRFRPLNVTKDNYSSYKHKGQTSEDYYIHPNWTDAQVRKFRRNVRRHNICMRHEVDYHSTLLERKKIPQEQAHEYRTKTYNQVKNILPDAWTPYEFHDASEQDYYQLTDLKKVK